VKKTFLREKKELQKEIKKKDICKQKLPFSAVYSSVTIEANNIEYGNIEKWGGWLNRNHSDGNIEFNFENSNIDSKTGSNWVIASPIIISRGPPPPPPPPPKCFATNNT